jgi:hypothetical protein
VKRNRSDVTFIKMLVDLKDIAFPVERGRKGLVQGWQVVTGDVDDWSVHGGNRPD